MSRTDMPHADPDQDRAITRTDADMDSETRFGRRPVPEGHRRPSGPLESRRIPPSGPVSPDGSRSYPRPSRSAKWLVWGGTALAAAAATAGTVYAARQIAGLIAGDDRDRPARPGHGSAGAARYRPAPTFSRHGQPLDDPDERLQDGPRERGYGPRLAERPRDGEPPRPRGPGGPKRRRKPPTLMQEIQHNTSQLGNSVEGVMRTLGSAVTGFRGVAGQAGAIIREFSDAAALVREILDSRPEPRSPHDEAPPPERGRAAATAPRDQGTAPIDTRTHRL